METKTGSGLDLDGSYFHLNSPITDWDISLITFYATGIPNDTEGFRRIISNLSYQKTRGNFHVCDLFMKGAIMRRHVSLTQRIIRYPQSLKMVETICSILSTRDPLIPSRECIKGDKFISSSIIRDYVSVDDQAKGLIGKQLELFFQLSRLRSFLLETGCLENRVQWKSIKNNTINRVRKELGIPEGSLPATSKKRAEVIAREEYSKLSNHYQKNLVKTFNVKQDSLILFVIEEGLLIQYNSELHIIPKSAFLGYIDSMECELNLYIFSNMKPYLVEVGKLARMIRTVVIDYGTSMFEIHKNIVPFVQSEILSSLIETDIDIYNQFSKTAKDNIEKVIEESKDHFGETYSSIIRTVFQKIKEVMGKIEEEDKSDLIALEKCCLHPILDARDALNKVREHISTPHEIDNEAIHKVLACFKAIIINGYLKKYQVGWPKIDPLSLVSEDLKRLHFKSMPLTNQVIKNHWFEISEIRFLKNFNANEYDPTPDLLQDKAIAPIKREWLTCFSGSVLGEMRAQPTLPKRLIDYMLKVPEMKSLEVLKHVASRQHLLEKDNNISYSMKEKENKTSARLFAKMTCDLRACQIVLEGLTAQFIAPLFPEHGSVLSFLDLEKELSCLSSLQHSYTHKKKELRSEVTYLTTDLVKYCLRWRSQVTAPFFRALDDLFGFDDVFNWMHPFLATSRLFVADPGYPPLLHLGREIESSLDDEFFIDGALGGIEGYQQKEWSAISIALIKASAIWSGTIAPSIVQGDNQVIAITSLHYTGQTQDKINNDHVSSVESFIEKFTEFNKALGHELKLEETIISKEVFVYSKKIYRKGRSFGLPGKKVMKSFCFDPDADINFLSSIALYESCICSGIKEGLTPDPSAWNEVRISLFIKTLVAHASLSPSDRVESLNCLTNMIKLDFLPVFLHVFMGGFSTLTNESFTMQRVDDVLTSSIQTLLSICGDQVGSKILLKRMKGIEETTPLRILMNPLGVELDDGLREEPPALDGDIREIMFESRNDLVVCALNHCGREELEIFATSLFGEDSVHVLLASTIFDNSLQGKLFGFLNGLCKTRTIQQKVLKRSKHSSSRRRVISKEASGKAKNFIILLENERFQPKTRKGLDLFYYEREGYHICSFSVAEDIRVIRGKMCKGAEKLNIKFHTSPSIREIIKIQKEPPPIFMPHIIATISKGAGGSPYFGSTTEERTNHNDWDEDTLTPPGRRAIQMATLSKWVTGGTKICEGVIRNLLQVSDQIESLEDLPEQVLSRNFDHRLKSTRAESTYMVPYKEKNNYKMSFTTNFFKITGEMIMENASSRDLDSDDTNIIYQNCIIHCLSSLLGEFEKILKSLRSDSIKAEVQEGRNEARVEQVMLLTDITIDSDLKKLSDDSQNMLVLYETKSEIYPQVMMRGDPKMIVYGVMRKKCCIRLSDFNQVPFSDAQDKPQYIRCDYKPFATCIVPKLRKGRESEKKLALCPEDRLGYLMGYYLGRILVRSSSKVRGLNEENFLEVSVGGSHKNFSSEVSLCDFDSFVTGLVWGLLYTILSYLNPDFVSCSREIEPHVTQMMVSITHRGLETLKNTLTDRRVQECRSRSKIRWSYYGVSTENQSILEDLQYLVMRTFKALPDVLQSKTIPPLILDNKRCLDVHKDVNGGSENPYITTIEKVLTKLYGGPGSSVLDVPVVHLDEKIPVICRSIVVHMRNMQSLGERLNNTHRELSLPDRIRVSLGLESTGSHIDETIGLEKRTQRIDRKFELQSNIVTGIYVEPTILRKVEPCDNSKLIHLCTRTHGLNSTTGFKCITLMNQITRSCAGQPILMLGEGSGNLCATTLKLSEYNHGDGNFEVYVQSLYGDHGGISKELWIPSEVENTGYAVQPLFSDRGLYFPRCEKGVFSLQPFPMTTGDVLDPNYLSRLAPIIEKCHIITCDAEFESGTNPHLVFRFIDFILTRSRGIFIIKCLMRQSSTTLIDLILGSIWYKEIKVLAYVPYNQGFNDLEVYLTFRLEVDVTPILDVNLIARIRRPLSLYEWMKETQSERTLIEQLGIPSNLDKIQLLLRISPRITGREKKGDEIIRIMEESIVNRVKMTRRTLNKKFSDLSWTQDPASMFQIEMDYIVSQIILLEILENFSTSNYHPEDIINTEFSFQLRDSSLTITNGYGMQRTYSFRKMNFYVNFNSDLVIPRPLGKNILKLAGHILLIIGMRDLMV